nr:MAG TPA: hypothetical protein [Crassvirales sp.]
MFRYAFLHSPDYKSLTPLVVTKNINSVFTSFIYR